MANHIYNITVDESDAAIISESLESKGQSIEEWIADKVSKLAETQAKVNLASKLRQHRGTVKHFVLDAKLGTLEDFVQRNALVDRVAEYGGYGKLVQLYAQGGVMIPAKLVRKEVVAVNPPAEGGN